MRKLIILFVFIIGVLPTYSQLNTSVLFGLADSAIDVKINIYNSSNEKVYIPLYNFRTSVVNCCNMTELGFPQGQPVFFYLVIQVDSCEIRNCFQGGDFYMLDNTLTIADLICIPEKDSFIINCVINLRSMGVQLDLLNPTTGHLYFRYMTPSSLSDGDKNKIWRSSLRDPGITITFDREHYKSRYGFGQRVVIIHPVVSDDIIGGWKDELLFYRSIHQLR